MTCFSKVVLRISAGSKHWSVNYRTPAIARSTVRRKRIGFGILSLVNTVLRFPTPERLLFALPQLLTRHRPF